ncbi:MAG: hypothetical protein RBU27_06765 [Bacteroidota bacterium]|nr:hypothetical protein [Bacteroidota bacterium]
MKHRVRWKLTGVLLLLLVAPPRELTAQDSLAGGAEPIRWPDRPRFAEGRVSVMVGTALTKYFGEFSGHEVAPAATARLHYSLTPFLDIGGGVEVGQLRYTRRNRRNLGQTYPYQFGDAPPLARVTDATATEAWVRLHLFPSLRFDAWILAGMGYAWLRPQDYREGRVAFPGPETIAALSVPLGAGLAWHFNGMWSLQAGMHAHLVMSGEIDAFDSGDLVTRQQRELGLPVNPDREKTANDTWLSAFVGITCALFEDHDRDGDGLSNQEEQELNLNPDDADTDGDGLDDHAEVRVHGTDPLYWDSDRDVLSDWVEVTRYGTDPTNADTDGDGLTDSFELLDYLTDPLSADTEGDGLVDGEEKRLGCHPKKVDTDGDGLYDGDEVSIHRTNPVLPDSDGEGINDADEVRQYRTDPNRADTDRDGLTDYEEIRLHHTDPLTPDTDGDGRSDYEELRRDGSDPLRAKTTEPSAIPRTP